MRPTIAVMEVTHTWNKNEDYNEKMTPTLEKLIKALRAQKYSLFIKCQIANSE